VNDRHDIHYFALAEAGTLEQQALLLCDSVRRFVGRHARAPITVISPRAARRPGAATRAALAAMDVAFVALDVDSPCPDYGTSFRVAAAAHLERESRAEFLLQLDSGTLFLREPTFDCAGFDALARPVDVQGVCTADGDERETYWRDLCALCGVTYESMPWVTTTVDRKRVRANYNGGLIMARRTRGLLQLTEEFFRRIVAARRYSHPRPSGPLRIGAGACSPEGFTYWGTAQIAFALACAARNAPVGVLPPSYNVPLHLFADLPPDPAPVHVHYHWLFESDVRALNPLLDGRVPLSAEQSLCLQRRFPLCAA
jgi:hypothetical protein